MKNADYVTSLCAALALGCCGVPPPARAQLAIDKAPAGRVDLKVCNEGKAAFDAIVSQAGKVAASRIEPGTCRAVSEGTAPASVGFAFADASGQWTSARSQGLIPDFGANVLSPGNTTATVQRGAAPLTLPLLLNFRPRGFDCETLNTYSAVAHLPLNATVSQRMAAEAADARRAPAETVCETLDYVLHVEAVPGTREVSFRDANKSDGAEPARKLTWNDLLEGLKYVTRVKTLYDVMPRYIMIRGTVSSVDIREDPYEPGVKWVDVGFRESPEVDRGPNTTPRGNFMICASKPELFAAVFGSDFRTSLIGKAIEVDGEISTSCKGLQAGIRVTLARQMRKVDSAQFPAGSVARFSPEPAKP